MLNGDAIRTVEQESIRRFIESQAHLFAGARVLDYGCGRQPYRDVIEAAGGEYRPYDRKAFAGNVSGEDVGSDEVMLDDWNDVVVCTQVIQYVRNPVEELRIEIRNRLRPQGHLVLTGPTNWPEVEPGDLHRFTLTGAVELVRRAGFEVVESGTRALVEIPGWTLSLGYGIVAQA